MLFDDFDLDGPTRQAGSLVSREAITLAHGRFQFESGVAVNPGALATDAVAVPLRIPFREAFTMTPANPMGFQRRRPKPRRAERREPDRRPTPAPARGAWACRCPPAADRRVVMQRRPSLASPVTVGLLLLLVACGGPPNGGVPASTMVLKVDTTLSPGTTVTLPLRGDVDVTVRWGDGHVGLVTEGGDLSHTYAAEGEYRITLSGSLTQFGSGYEAHENSDKLTAVTAWGALGLVSLAGAFRDAVHLTTVPADLPPTVTDASYLFRGATSFNQDIGGWDLRNVTNTWSMFHGATSFDQDIGGWDTGNVTLAGYMFNQTVFNHDIGGWDVGNVTNMMLMFGGAAFDQDIGGWDVGNVTNMHGVFSQTTAFDQDIGGWDVGNVRNMRYMFFMARGFDRDIGGWDVANVTDMSRMFYAATAFDQDIGGWNVGNVTDMQDMFAYATAFDQDLSGWCVTHITEEPPGFATGATAWVLPKPVWGTCP